MSVSAALGARIWTLSSSISSGYGGVGGSERAAPRMMVIECSSRPQKKATAHHMKTRPKKSQPWDIKRQPTVYPPLPVLPPDWTLISDADEAAASHAPPPPTRTK